MVADLAIVAVGSVAVDAAVDLEGAVAAADLETVEDSEVVTAVDLVTVVVSVTEAASEVGIVGMEAVPIVGSAVLIEVTVVAQTEGMVVVTTTEAVAASGKATVRFIFLVPNRLVLQGWPRWWRHRISRRRRLWR